MAHGAKTSLATKGALDFVQPHLSSRAIGMYEDNETTKALAENPQGSHRSKHIDVRFHFLRGLVRLVQVTIHSVASAEQHADILTKPLGREAFRMSAISGVGDLCVLRFLPLYLSVRLLPQRAQHASAYPGGSVSDNKFQLLYSLLVSPHTNKSTKNDQKFHFTI